MFLQRWAKTKRRLLFVFGPREYHNWRINGELGKRSVEGFAVTTVGKTVEDRGRDQSWRLGQESMVRGITRSVLSLPFNFF